MTKGPPRMLPPFDWICPSGICQCGCGQPTAIARYTSSKDGIFIGYPLRYIHGHNRTNPTIHRGVESHKWKGGRIRDSNGYILIFSPSHPRADHHGYVFEHRLNWEKGNGRLLTSDEHVHHINGIKDDNRPENLVALTQRAHRTLHAHDVSPETRRKLSESGRKAWADNGARRRRI